MTNNLAQESVGAESEFLEAVIAVCAARLAVAGILWCIALSVIDRVAFRNSDPFVFNLRLGLWMYFAETLVATYAVRYSAPASYPLAKRIAFVSAEVLRQCAICARDMTLHMAVRW